MYDGVVRRGSVGEYELFDFWFVAQVDLYEFYCAVGDSFDTSQALEVGVGEADNTVMRRVAGVEFGERE